MMMMMIVLRYALFFPNLDTVIPTDDTATPTEPEQFLLPFSGSFALK
jgi:hypothetical protein